MYRVRNEIFTTENLQRHFGAVHQQVKDKQCPECDATFVAQGNLDQHIKAIHRQIKDQKCPECDFVCASSSSLGSHIKLCTMVSGIIIVRIVIMRLDPRHIYDGI